MIIHHLDPHEAQKIAAGEVVERPAHILKELIENALDAQATSITVTLEDGGKTSLTVSDNGCGMVDQDTRICFLRHTTSKVSNFDDLQTITTFGFRGEALASICSVARVTLITRHATQEYGRMIEVAQGVIVKDDIIAAPIGTTITITELFEKIPARKKFLKTTQTELSACTQLFKAICLSHCNVSFTLIHNNTMLYTCPASDALPTTLSCLFDTSIAKQCFTISHTQESIICTGIASGPHYSRYDRTGIFLFVNNRWVKNYQLTQAVIKGYMNVLQQGKFPLAVIHIKLPGSEVDINTHPKKEEVVFLHPKKVESVITHALTKGLEQHLSVRLSETQQPTYLQQPYSPYKPINPHTTYQPFAPYTQSKTTTSLQTAPVSTIASALSIPPDPFTPDEIQETHILETLHSYPLLGQLHTTYLILQHPDGLLMIDQHAAHERIIYERIGSTFKNSETITLLFPETISLSTTVSNDLEPYLKVLTHFGIHLEQTGPHEYMVHAKPAYTQTVNITELLHTMHGWITELGHADIQNIEKVLTEKIRAQIACKSAIKAGDTLSHEHMMQLLKDLDQTEHRFSCPHGRPTSWLLPLYDIEKKFKRRV